MSKLSDSIKNPMRDKALRLTKGDPTSKVDSSTWTPPEAENAGVKTGLRPLSKRQYKSGGKVHGANAKKRADRLARKSGGRTEAEDRSKRYLTPDNLLNRDVRMANEQREGTKHVGGFKKGGKVHRKHHADGDVASGDVIANLIRQDQIQQAMKGRGLPSRVPLPPVRPMDRPVKYTGPMPTTNPNTGYKKGGAAHPDVKEDKALIRKMVKPSAMKRDEHCWGGETKSKKADGGKIKWIQGAIKHPGSLHKALHVPEGQKIPAKKLEKASHSDNPKLAKKANLAKTLKRMHHASGGEVFEGNSTTKIPGKTGGRTAKAYGGPMGAQPQTMAMQPQQGLQYAQQQQPYGMGMVGGGMPPRFPVGGGMPPRPPVGGVMPPRPPMGGGMAFPRTPVPALMPQSNLGMPPQGMQAMPQAMYNAGGRTPHAKGGKTKGKTNININVMPHHPGMGGPMGGPPMGGAPMPPPPPPPGPPMGGPPPMGPPPGGPMGGPPMPPPGMPPMPRKSGGRAGKDLGGSLTGGPSGPQGMGGLSPQILQALKNADMAQKAPAIAGGGMTPQQLQALANLRTNPQADLTGAGALMGRKHGGRTTAKTEHVIDHAAGGGLGRLEKIKAYGQPQKRMK